MTTAVNGNTNNTGIPATRLLGEPKIKEDASGKLRVALIDEVLDLQELKEIWGITPAQLKGLERMGIVWQDGIDVGELKDIEALMEKKQAKFVQIFQGTGVAREKLEELYGELWQLAMAGKLDNAAWDNLMKKYGLDEYVMTGSAFQYLIAMQDGYTDDNVVEGAAEFCAALDNLVLTCKINAGGKENTYAIALKRLCKERSFRIIRFDKVNDLFMTCLKTINPKYDFEGKSEDQIFEAIGKGDFGNRLKELVEYRSYRGIKTLEDLTIYFLSMMQKAVQDGSDEDYESQVQAALDMEKKMDYLIKVLNSGGADIGLSENYEILVDEAVAYLKEEKDFIAFEKIKKPETAKNIEGGEA